MIIYICVDDTDDLTKSTSTGKIAGMIGDAVEEIGAKMIRGITRHQLLIHDDIEYTSHNSSMCMVMDVEADVDIEQIKSKAEDILYANMAESSDPGICICRIDKLEDPQALISYGKRAQNEVLTKQEAYEMAEKVGGTILNEYGGTGIGVIGALAGVGLRLSGNDGFFRGGKRENLKGQTHKVSEWRELIDIEKFLDFDGNELAEDALITVDGQIKTCLVDHKITLISKITGDTYTACKKKELYNGDKRVVNWTSACSEFVQDNDIEECYDETEHACYNCLYRRWTADGFVCVRQ